MSGARRRVPLAVAALAAYLLLYASWQALHWLPGRQALGQLFLVPVDAVALLAALAAARRCDADPSLRRFWRLMALAIGSQAVADLLLAEANVRHAVVPFPTVSDAFYIGFYVLLLLALASVPALSGPPALRARTLLDVATLVIGGGTVVWYLVLGPTALEGGQDPLATAVSVAYPIGDLILLACLAAALLRRSARTLRTPLLLISAAILCSIVADVVYGYGVLHGTYRAGDPVDALYVLEFALLALAATFQRPVTAPLAAREDAAYERPTARASLLPYAGLAIGFGLVLGVEAGDTFFPDFSLLLIVIVLASIAATRQWLVQRELLQVQAALQASERRLRAIFDNAAVGITFTDVDGPRVLDVNPAFARMVGHPRERLIGGDYSLIAHPDEAEADRELARAAQAGPTDPLRREQRFVRADGSVRWAVLTLTILPDEQGVPHHAVGIFEDVTRRREAERAKDEFVAVVGHELRTPLTSIRGSLGLIDSGVAGEVGDEAGELVRIAIASTDRLTRLVNDILDVERMQAGRIDLTPAPTPVAGIVEASLQAVAAAAAAAGVELAAPHVEDAVVEADADRAVQTLVNLLGNAVKFSPPGSVVTVSVEREGADAHVCVRDRGRGIPADRLEAIFERFEQVDASDAREKGGTGLGLALARAIVEQHGGRIWAESGRPGMGPGAAFHFTLPLAAAGAASAAPPAEEVRS